MKWMKKGVIFASSHNYDWMVSHASIPVASQVCDDVLRIFFGTRDRIGNSHTTYLDVEANCPQRIRYVHDKPLLSLGTPGTFDDSGIMPSWIVHHADKILLYYIGWNRQVSVPYRLAIGLAISEDNGRTFHKFSDGPVCDRSIDEPFFNTAPCVLFEGDKWRMWYVSCTGWEVVNERMEPQYHIRYAESRDGLLWLKSGHVCIDYGHNTEAIGRPCVYKENGIYKMFYSYRSVRDYRSNPAHSYRLGYAESADGLSWTRQDVDAGIERSEAGWDSEMIEYCYIHEHGGKKYLFYNGNGFGATGFGYAESARG